MCGMCEDKGAEQRWWSGLSVLPVLSSPGAVCVLAVLYRRQWEQLGSSAGPLAASRSCQHGPSVSESLCTENAAAASGS